MGEYKFLKGSPETIQKMLNQWRHSYKIDIHAMQVEDGVVYMLINRKSLNENMVKSNTANDLPNDDLPF